ncbi:MAG: hypothetical protein HKN82_09565 [Akkermansiaceae bacterium]|nr:hypothetical protein [Akkermansiaceae bacterium]
MKSPRSASLPALLGAILVPLLLGSCADYYGYGPGSYGDAGYGGYPSYHTTGIYTSSLFYGSNYYRHRPSVCSRCGYNPCRCARHSTHRHHPISKHKHHGSHPAKKYHPVTSHPRHPFHHPNFKRGDHSSHKHHGNRPSADCPPDSHPTRSRTRGTRPSSPPVTRPGLPNPGPRKSAPRPTPPRTTPQRQPNPNMTVTTSRPAPRPATRPASGRQGMAAAKRQLKERGRSGR